MQQLIDNAALKEKQQQQQLQNNLLVRDPDQEKSRNDSKNMIRVNRFRACGVIFATFLLGLIFGGIIVGFAYVNKWIA